MYMEQRENVQRPEPNLATNDHVHIDPSFTPIHTYSQLFKTLHTFQNSVTLIVILIILIISDVSDITLRLLSRIKSGMDFRL